MRRGQDYSPISPSKLSSTSFRNFNLYHKYENMSLMNKLPGDSYEDLFRSKLVLNDPFISLEAKNAQDKYAELEKHVRELYEEFKLHCIPGEVRDMIPEPKDADSDPVEVAKAIKGILQLLQKTLKEQEQVNLLNVENRKDIDYEMLLQKAEGDIKKHIRTHQQLKFAIETMQAKIEEYDSDKGIFLQNAKSVFKDAKSDNKTLIDMIRQKDTEIHILNAKMKQKDETIKSHEERLLSIPILEHKIKGLKDSHAKEKELVKQYYQQEFANLTKEVQHIHKVLSTNMNLDERLKMLEQELNTYKSFNVKKLQSLEDKLSQFDSHHEKIENVLSQAVSLHEGLDPTDIKSTILAAVSPTRAPVKIHNRPRNLLQNKSVSSLHKALEEKHTIHKQRLVKKKSEVSDEIKMLSVSRIQDLTQEIADPHQDFHRSTSPKKFDSYFIALKRKLDKLSQINNKEREFLKSINSQTAEIPARETRTRQAVSRVVVKRLNDESMHDHRPAFLSPKSVQSKTNTNRASSVQPKV